MAQIYEIYGRDAHAMTVALLEAGHPADGLPRSASIALKPNLVTSSTPESGATTHPGVLSGCISYFQSRGFRNISIIEGSWVGENTRRAFQSCGYDRVCQEYGVPFYDLKKDRTRKVRTPMREMEICCRALDADFLISLPVLKGHCQTLMTCALKNSKGCIPDREKRRFHTEGLNRPIAALAAALKPDLTIVDSICGDLNFEEGGNPVQTDRMYMGTDQVQLDTYGCSLMGLELEDVPYISLAEQWGAGSTALRPEDIITLNDPASAPAFPKPPGLAGRLTRNVRENSACSACYASLVRALYTSGNTSVPVYIGQGWKGCTLEGLGFGSCCAGAEISLPGCPPTAAAAVSFLREHG